MKSARSPIFGRAATCAQFCAHHQARLSVMDCRGIAEKPCQTSHLWYSVTSGHCPCKLLVLRATSTWAQGVRGSNPRAPTNIPCSISKFWKQQLRKSQLGSDMGPIFRASSFVTADRRSSVSKSRDLSWYTFPVIHTLYLPNSNRSRD